MKPWLIMGAIVLIFAAVPVDRRQSASPLPADAQRFSHQVIIDQARRLAAEPYDPPQLPPESPLKQLTRDQYSDIRVDSGQGIWRRERVPFRVELLPAGFVYETPVTVRIVENGAARNLSATAEKFTLGEQVRHLTSQTLPISGFRVRSRINAPDVWDEFINLSRVVKNAGGAPDAPETGFRYHVELREFHLHGELF